MDRYLALELASTIRHDGDGGVADDLADVDGLAGWVRAQAALLDAVVDPRGFVANDAALAEVLGVRRAVRALFARAVRPGPPSPADAHRLLPQERALAVLNEAAERAAFVPRLVWAPDDEAPSVSYRSAEPDPAVRLAAALATAAIDFLSGPHREKLRACTAPRCVRYYLKTHGRQEWCKPSCGNRARVARHYQRHKGSPAG
ncbi:CGNR zinc finger domain-containing protein [Streptomyces sp. B6B3]|uniref:CGNR zinc finger domain-containing protein n=1 Tax=Streptomyces sp. B6B3 TaxID=3153570 RepID=UPI00325D92B0